jgi:hypothetical protein
MAKVQVPNTQDKKKNKKEEDEDVLVGRVKKVVKKSRRKLSEEKFERQLQRTIAFLEELQTKLNDTHNSVASEKKKTPDRKTKPESSRKPVRPTAKPTTKSAK